MEQKETAVAFTGHRKLAGEYPPSAEWKVVETSVLSFIVKLSKEYTRIHFVSGGALGFDQVAAEAVIMARTMGMNISLTFALPFPGFQRKWPKQSQEHLDWLLQQADKIVHVDKDPTYAPWKMQKRNQFMVDRSSIILALLIQGYSRGGTFNCVRYAVSHKEAKTVLCMNPHAWKGDGLHSIHPFPMYWR